jgi:hypothetical protein
MTLLLEKLIAEASKLPDAEQDLLAARVLEEIEDEKRWDTSFANSENLLSEMADEALAE